MTAATMEQTPGRWFIRSLSRWGLNALFWAAVFARCAGQLPTVNEPESNLCEPSASLHKPEDNMVTPLSGPPLRQACRGPCQPLKQHRGQTRNYLKADELVLSNWRQPSYQARDSGSRMRSTEPWPGVLSTSMAPPWASAIHLPIDKPRPAPPISRERALSAR